MADFEKIRIAPTTFPYGKNGVGVCLGSRDFAGLRATLRRRASQISQKEIEIKRLMLEIN
jgi:hypothetical protein